MSVGFITCRFKAKKLSVIYGLILIATMNLAKASGKVTSKIEIHFLPALVNLNIQSD